jgi:RND family efflux transporter MFP subunit
MQFTSPPAVQYTQAAATTGNIAQTVSSTGQVQPGATYNLNFTASGQIQTIYVHAGQQVKQGQALAKLNSPSLQDAVNQAQQAVNNAQTTYNDAVNNGASSTTLDNDNGQLQSAQDQLKTAQDNLQAATLTAPHAGIIAAINGMVGEQAGSGGSSSSSSSSTSSGFIVLLDMSSLTITVQVNEADISGVQVGQPVVFTVAAYPSRTFRASVASIDVQGQSSSNVVTYPVTLAVDNQSLSSAHIYAGMTATVNITTAERIGTLLVPASALSFSTTAIQNGELTTSQLRALVAGASSSGFGSTQGSRGIIVELKNGKLVPVLVRTGLSNGQFTEILSGLNAGDQVVVSQTGGQTTTTSSGTTGASRLGGGGFGGGGFGGGGGGGRSGGGSSGGSGSGNGG